MSATMLSFLQASFQIYATIFLIPTSIGAVLPTKKKKLCESITLGRAASNTVVLDDEFVSSHHARIYKDPASGQWAIEDLGSTNGTIVNQQRLNMPMLLPPRMPVRIGATTFELR